MSAPIFVGDGNDNEYEDFGSTTGLHKSMMGALWSPCANIAIILIIYSYRKYWVWLHMAFFGFATIITLVTSLPIWAYTGIISASDPRPFEYSAGTLRAHYILGIVCCFSVFLVSTLGGVTKLLNVCKAQSTTILLIRRIHTWSGYVAVWTAKANIYILGEDAGVWIAIDAISTIVYIGWRLLFPKLEARGISPKYEESIPSAKSVLELDQSQEYIVFANNIYNI